MENQAAVYWCSPGGGVKGMLPANFSSGPCQFQHFQQPGSNLVVEVFAPNDSALDVTSTVLAEKKNKQVIPPNVNHMAMENGEKGPESTKEPLKPVGLLNGSGVHDLSSVNAMMSVVMNATNISENSGVFQNTKSPAKSPAPNRIGRRNQESKEEKSSYICPLCEKVCNSQHQLTMHIRQHNTDTGGTDHSCSICGKALSSASSLDRHMLVHSGERPYKCSMCGQSFTTNGNMHRHMKIHEKDPNVAVSTSPPSPQKRRRLSSKRKSVPESETEKEEPSPSKKVAEEIPPAEPLKKTDDVVHCPMCFKEFACKSDLDSHMETHPEASLKCDICCISFRTHRGMLRHNAAIHKLLPRDPSGKPFIQSNPSIPAGFNDLGFTDFSAKKFPLISQVWCESNLRRCISDGHRFVCNNCNKAFPMYSALQLHMESHGDVQPNNNKQSKKTENLTGVGQDQKSFMAALGLQYTKDIKPDGQEENSQDCLQAIQPGTFKSNLPQERGSTGMLNRSPLEASCVNGPFSVLPPTKENIKPFSLQHFQKVFTMQPDNSIVVKPISGELADIQQILKMATSAPSQISLPSVGKPAPVGAQTFYKHMPSLKPKPLVAPRTVVAASTPPPLLNTQQATPGCISPSLPQPPFRMVRSTAESSASAIFMQSRSGANCGSSLNTQISNTDTLSQRENKLQMEQDSIIEAYMPLDLESKIKQEAGEGNMKPTITGANHKKATQSRKDSYPCRFCDQVFSYSGVLRAHIRTHLGISPYQCNICDYIAADKAALIRHLRTHSGERPYICKICQYPFTVKANCERHLRKKHLKITRKDIEKNIDYVSTNTADVVEALCSPDTICKFCGEDLKNYRALHIHMRTHTNFLKIKPFECKDCGTTFSAKRNCIHHILKQHQHVQEKDIENHILARACSPEQTRSGSTLLQDSTYIDQTSATPYMESKNGFLHGGFSTLPLKVESSTTFPTDPDQPLDFSQKSKNPSGVQIKQEPVFNQLFSSADSSMEPIDLSIPKHTKQDKTDSPFVLKTHEQAPRPVGQIYNCQPCSLPLSANEMIEKPAAITHSKPLKNTLHLTVPIISPAVLGSTTILRPLRPKPPPLLPKPTIPKDLPPLASIAQIISSVSSASALLKGDHSTHASQLPANHSTAADKHGASKPKTIPHTDPPASSDVPTLVGNLVVADKTAAIDIVRAKKRGRKKGTKNKPKSPNALDLESSGEFASIEKMLATTDTNKFSPYLQSTEDTKEVSDRNGTSEDERDSSEEKKGKRNSYSNSVQKITCPYCPRVFPWASSLQRHMLTHTGQKPYPCAKCDAFFSTKSNCERHLLRKHGVANLSLRRNGLLPQSKESDDGSHDSTDSQSDAEMSATEGDVLDLTSGSKDNAEDVPAVVEEQGPKGDQIESSVVDNKEETKEKTDEHKEHLEDDTVSNKSLDLNFASKLIDFKLSAGDHTAASCSSNSCDVCGKSFKFAATLGRHKKAHSCEHKEEKSSEDESKDISDSPFDLSHPVSGTEGADMEEEELPVDLKVSISPMENEPSANQKLDGETVFVEEGLDRKSSEKSDDDKESKASESKGTSKADKRKKICTVCTKRFWSLQDLTRHMRSHTGERPYKCQTCERTFTLKHSLVRHQRIHQKVKDLRSQGKDSEREDRQLRCDEESDSESLQSSTQQTSENEYDAPASVGQSMTRSKKVFLVNSAGEESSQRSETTTGANTSRQVSRIDSSRDPASHKISERKSLPGFSKEPEKSAINHILITAESTLAIMGTK